jgi:hypothetical protein
MAWDFLLAIKKNIMSTNKPQGADKQGKPRKEEDVKKEMDIRKKGQKQEDKEAPKGLTKEDLPDATNESIGAMGSGQRQDSN